MSGQAIILCSGWKKKYKLFIVTLATLTIQWERWDNKWEDSNMAELEEKNKWVD